MTKDIDLDNLGQFEVEWKNTEGDRARRDELHPWRREPTGAAGGDGHATDLWRQAPGTGRAES